MLSILQRKPSKIFKTESGETVYGMMAEFATPADLYQAAEAVRDAGYRKWDVYSPFPVHGMEEAMGLPDSKIGLVAGVIGLTGAGLGFLMQYGITHLYPLVVQGKPPEAWEAYVPITFEIGVLTTAFTCLIGMFIFNKLPMWYHPLLKKERFLRVSDDRFVIAVEASDPSFDPEVTRKLLSDAGGTGVELVEE